MINKKTSEDSHHKVVLSSQVHEIMHSKEKRFLLVRKKMNLH